jgi:uncharacterized protein with von Willebrand factor type A (vWA) domain
VFTPFIEGLRSAGVPVSITEHLALLGAIQAQVVEYDVEDFYFLARAALVKDERWFDRFDQVFATYFRGLEAVSGSDEDLARALPAEWLRKLAEKTLSPEEMAAVEALGGFEKLMETLRQRLEEQEGRHQGGSKWIGTAGTSPFGAYGYNPEGVRIGQAESRHRRAVKVWDRREFRDLDDGVELNTRTLKLALRKLRRFAREGAAEQLNLDRTIRATAENAGTLDLRFTPERRNAMKVLLFLDVGGSMDDHVKASEELFSAARSEFKHLEYFYFHNCVYEGVWKSNARRRSEQTPTEDVLRTFGPDYRLIFVGDAAMSPYEISHPGGAVEHWNAESGATWMERLTRHFRRAAWLNPTPEPAWSYTHSTRLLQELMEGRMYPLTLDGLERMTRELSR